MARRSTVASLFAFAAITAGVSGVSACRDNITRFSTKNDHYVGEIVKGSFVRNGMTDATKICLTFDGDHVQDGPGVITTNDGRFRATPLRPIPQLFHDPLSTLEFGSGRVQNLVYVATPNAVGDAGPEDLQDVMVFVSLMETGAVEVRLVRGAPQGDAGVGAITPKAAAPLFGVFALEKREGACVL